MPQWKAFTTGSLFALAAIGSVVAGIATLATGDPSQLGGYLLLASAFALPAALLLGLWSYRRQRDHRIAKQAATNWQRQPSSHSLERAVGSSAQTLPPMVSKGSNNSLFVPPPLQ